MACPARKAALLLVVCLATTTFLTDVLLANGGPFVIKYPDGDSAAKSVLARLGPDLKPARETRLRVVKEDLSVAFRARNADMPPVATVSAAYTIENPTDEEVEVDFGFPILRGIYILPYDMARRPHVGVRVDDADVPATLISNSAIYGIIRQGARRAIDRGLAADPKLRGLVEAVSDFPTDGRAGPEEALGSYLTDSLGWTDRDAALMVAYAGLDVGKAVHRPRDRGQAYWWTRDDQLRRLVDANLGPLAAIGEQKTTQLFAQLAGRFEPETAAKYEAIFTAWGGDIRERSVDLKTGEVRPREITVDATDEKALGLKGYADPTIYARVEYLDERADITEDEKVACRAILKNLPVIFTFAPMNLLHYNVTFPPGGTRQLTVEYSQYAYRDTADPESYQLAYVVHPASMWDSFGPINLKVAVPKRVPFRASIATEAAEAPEGESPLAMRRFGSDDTAEYDLHGATLEEKTGEIFLAVNAEAWHEHLAGDDDQDVAIAPAPQAQKAAP